MAITITVNEIKESLDDYNYSNLTGADDTKCERAILSAEIWVKAKLSKVGVTADFTDEIVKEATIKRTLYELYSRVENESIARDKADDCINLLRAVYGSGIDDDTPDDNRPADEKGAPLASVEQGDDNWEGFE